MGNLTTLGVLLKRVGNYDGMETFGGRLMLQKTIYLMQSFDLYLGYTFSWYIRGPYCTELTRDGYALRDSYNTLPEGKFKDDNAEKRFKQFLKFISKHRTDPDWLEIIASIHFLRKVYPSLTKAKIIEIVKNKQSYFTEEDCIIRWKELEKRKMI